MDQVFRPTGEVIGRPNNLSNRSSRAGEPNLLRADGLRCYA